MISTNPTLFFSERCTLKTIDSSSPNVRVLKRNELLRIIREEIDYSPRVFAQLQMDRIYAKLLDYSYVDNALKREHVKSVRERKFN